MPRSRASTARPRPRRVVVVIACAGLLAGLAACTTGASPAERATGAGTAATPPGPAQTGSSPSGAPGTGLASTPDRASTPAPGQSGAGQSAAATTGAPPSAGQTHAPAREHVDLIVTYAGWNAGPATAEVDAFAPGVLVDDGTCTLAMTRSGQTRSTSHFASVGPSSTQCGALTIERSRLQPGDWQAVVAFQSARYDGASKPVTITVPK